MPTLEKRPTKTELRRGRGAAPRDGAARRSGAHQDDGVFGSLLTDSIHQSWFVSLGQQLSELFRGKRKLPRVRGYDRRALAASEEAGISRLVIESVRDPWYRSLKLYFRSRMREKKLPPLRLSSRPIAVKSIWGTYDYKQQGVSWSAGGHVLLVVLLFTVFSGPALQQISGDSIDLVIDFDLSPYLIELRNAPPGDTGGGGGGGQNSPLPPSKGKLPRFDLKQLAPPTPVIKNLDPELVVEPTVIVPDHIQVPRIDMAVFGDPLSQIGPPSAGPGSGGGIGTGRGTGVGSGRGAGVGPGSGGGIGGGVFRIGGGVSAPRLTYKVEPEYSEEARKAKYQGTVVLAIEVWQDGRAHNIRVIRSLGLGLDEKAVGAVQEWKFVPGKKDGIPVKVRANVEVNFRLL